jgi:hypothetical protein
MIILQLNLKNKKYIIYYNETVVGSNKAKDLHPGTVTSPTAALRLKDLPPPQQ